MNRNIVAATAIAIVLVLVGCPNPVDWSDFRGVNLIEGRQFGAVDGSDESVWDAGTQEFVRFEPAEAAATPPLPAEMASDASVYRLELLNLIPNGDFEDAAVADGADGALTHWQETGNSGAEIITAADFNASLEAGGVDLAAFHGERLLSLNFEDRFARFYIDLSDTGAFEANAQFAVFIDFRTGGANFPLSLNHTNGTTDEQNQLQINRGEPADAVTSYRFPGLEGEDRAALARNTLTVGDIDASELSFGGSTAVTEQRIQLLADNIRLVRSDLEHGLTLVVPQGNDPLQPDRPNLVSGGTYTFSVWIGRDETVGGNNRFDPEFIRIAVLAEDTGNGETNFEPARQTRTFPRADSIAWSNVEYSFPGPSSPNFELTLSLLFGGGDPGTLFPGSILIAEPRLEYSPD